MIILKVFFGKYFSNTIWPAVSNTRTSPHMWVEHSVKSLQNAMLYKFRVIWKGSNKLHMQCIVEKRPFCQTPLDFILLKVSEQLRGGGTVHFRRIFNKLSVILSQKRNAKRPNRLHWHDHRRRAKRKRKYSRKCFISAQRCRHSLKQVRTPLACCYPHNRILILIMGNVLKCYPPSALWHCWLGNRK